MILSHPDKSKKKGHNDIEKFIDLFELLLQIDKSVNNPQKKHD